MPPLISILQPTFVLNTSTMTVAMEKNSIFLQSVIDAAQNDCVDSVLYLQMCYSVKTQPHTAKKLGYYAECISIAEARAAFNQGFEPHQIILTGPGKFWDTAHVADDDLYLTHCIE